MTRQVLGGVLPLPVLEVGRLHQDRGAVTASVLAVGGCVLDPHHHPVRHLAGARRPLRVTHVGDDHCASLADAELRAVALADAHPLGEPERSLEPGNRRPPRPGESTHSVLVRVDDANAHCARARANGAEILMEPTDFEYGERQYHAADLAGHQWTFSETLADMAPEQWGGETVD